MTRYITLLLALAAACVLATPAALAFERIKDGDTTVIKEGTVRLAAIDAFETDQTCRYEGARYPCGEMATRMLRRLAQGAEITCDAPDGGDWEKGSYGRWILVCHAGDIDLNASMVASGWALVNPRYDTRYLPLQKRARRENRGAWQGRFVEPWKWRDGERLE